MKRILILIICLLPIITKAQDPSKYELHKKIISETCIGGNGNGTFSLDFSSLQKTLIIKTNKKTFDKNLPNFVDEGKVSFSYNEQTKDHDIPQYEITYVLLKNGNPTSSFIISIDKEISAPITGINVLDITSLKCDKLIQSALGSGFYFRSSVSNSLKRYYSNDKKKLEIIVTKRRDGGFNFYIFKI
ncbi:hypothetical protein [Pedobacter xixiisoli]|uniref:Uncharacterized protein n=1 Tax=Pedobacter xixiisoli TaxID=1476464 RepID=A0A286ACZ3_9SPHI|nr:hypothetical protein [Pedobacter xixiisoli]SOD19772.1 hypothetical protein SAMN06297358_3477 [Pedobacter xixiisoli]